MDRKDDLARLENGAEAWNRWREANPDHRPVLRGVDLSRRNLAGANLKDTDLGAATLRGCNLHQANLANSSLNDADLSGATLTFAKLNATHFIEARLDDAELDDAELSGTDFTRANLHRTSLKNARLFHVVFADADLSGARHLLSCVHEAPSSIDSATWARSGSLPRAFLQGCGLPDWLIEAYTLMQPDLSNEEIVDITYRLCNQRIGQVVQISPVFVSYSHRDAQFVDQLGDALSQRGIRYWRDTHHAPAGRMEKIVDHAIRMNPLFLVVLSEHSVQSDWVEHEVRSARALQKELGRDVLCPIALDDGWKTSRWPARLREQVEEFNILDFHGWQEPELFDAMFERLLHGMSMFYEAEEED